MFGAGVHGVAAARAGGSVAELAVEGGSEAAVCGAVARCWHIGYPLLLDACAG
jgi:hypothetical protein